MTGCVNFYSLISSFCGVGFKLFFFLLFNLNAFSFNLNKKRIYITWCTDRIRNSLGLRYSVAYDQRVGLLQ